MKLYKVVGIAILALCTALLTFGSAAAGPEQAPPAPAGADWPTYGGNLFNQRYSSLNQINKSNVANLKGAWFFHTGYTDSGASFESTPVVVGGVLYITTGRDDVFALDATTGTTKWEYHPNLDLAGTKLCCGVDNRGVAVGSGKVFIARVDGVLVALDQSTGNVAWQAEVGSPANGYSETMAPQYYNGMVIVGIAGGEYETRGYVSAYNADTGALAWRFYTVPAPGEPGSETWPAGSNVWETGGAMVWTTPAVDPELGLVYVTTGNPGSDLDGSQRPGDNLYSDSIVALDAMTGAYRWHYQTVHHDIWDYDATSPAVLFDTTINGQTVKGLAQAGKTGFVYILDRTTGKPLIPIDEKPVGQDAVQKTAATQPIPRTDPFVPNDSTSLAAQSGYMGGPIFTPFEDMPVLILPGANGGSEWSPMSYSPDTNYVYITGINQPMIFSMHPSMLEPGNFKLGSSFVQVPGLETSGTLTAMDVRTGKIAWQKITRNMMIGGSTTTAGGLVFTGQGDGNFQAYDAQTGDLLWEFQTGAGANAAPAVYEVNGVQYVAIASGGNYQLDYPRGDTLWVFSLNGTFGPAAAPPAPPSVAPPPSLGAPVSTNQIDIVDFKYVPANAVVPVGTTVTWSQKGAFPHTVTSDTGVFDSGVLYPGTQFSFTFTQPGTYPYHCTVHPFMIGQIQVMPPVLPPTGVSSAPDSVLPEPEALEGAPTDYGAGPEVTEPGDQPIPVNPGVPVRLTIPSIGVDSKVAELSAREKNGNWVWETIPWVVGHYDTTALAGASGNAVFSGHVTSLDAGNVFANLHKVNIADEVHIFTENDDLTYVVTDVKEVQPTEAIVVASTPDATATLITCAGQWVRAEQQYSRRLVVTARLQATGP